MAGLKYSNGKMTRLANMEKIIYFQLAPSVHTDWIGQFGGWIIPQNWYQWIGCHVWLVKMLQSCSK